MKILIVNTFDISGGAARSAYRLHKTLLNEGFDSQMLVQNKISDDYTVLTEQKKIKKYLNKIKSFIDSIPVRFHKKRTKIVFSSSWLGSSGVINKINKINPDIVHLHWICSGMIKVEDIARIKAPIIWSLHDNWAFTGGCHVKWDCEKYKNECGACPILGSNKKNDLSRKVFKRKQKVFNAKKDMTIVGLSRWLNDASKNSTLLKDKQHINLPNLIDTTIFKPFDKKKAREIWNLTLDKKFILFGAVGATSDINKGFNKLSEALMLLNNEEIELLVFGSSEPQNPSNFGFKTHYLGKLSDDVSLVALYSAVDVVVVPSLQENLSNTIMESLSCGTLVTCFDVGGNSDMVDHKVNGYLAKPFDTTNLKDGIEWILNTPIYDELCKNAREKVLQKFDSKIVVQKYIKLYKDLLNNK